MNHRIAVVTGVSRERGIGTALCRALANEGADTFFTHWGRYEESMAWGAECDWPDDLERELRQMGVRASHIEVDLADPSENWWPTTSHEGADTEEGFA